MSDVEFNENNYSFYPRKVAPESKKPFLIKMLMEKGIAKDESAANRLLVISVIVIFAASIIVYFFLSPKHTFIPPITNKTAVIER